MTNERGGQMLPERNSLRRLKFKNLLHSEYCPAILMGQDDHNQSPHRNSSGSASSPRLGRGSPRSGDASPYMLSPWNQASPYVKSPWIRSSPMRGSDDDNNSPRAGLVGSLVREEGHVYSLAASGDLLYTGSDSKNVRVWKNLKEFSGFKSNSGLVKAIVIAGDKVFTGHQDGKIRIWRFGRSMTNRKAYKRVGSLPTTKDLIKSSVRPKSYVRVRRHRNVPWIRHFDAVSSMSLHEEDGLLYSASWDKTLKVWRVSDSKCLESINAHEDAVNAVATGFHRLVFTGSADGTVKVWRREFVGKSNSKHVLAQVLLRQENAVTSLAVDAASEMVYCGSSDGLVNFWEREKLFLYGGVLRGHKLAVLCLAAAGNLVLSGSADKSICVWRRAEAGVHTCLRVLTGHVGPVKCLAVAQDEDSSSSKQDQRWMVYSGSLDRSVKVWRVCERASDSASHS